MIVDTTNGVETASTDRDNHGQSLDVDQRAA
jgi:hypothetical protein